MKTEFANMKRVCALVSAIAFFASSVNGLAQGFMNLDFEAANLSGYGVASIEVPTNKAIPNWTASYWSGAYGHQPSSIVAYNCVSIGGAAISVFDANIADGPVPLQGKYSILFQGTYAPGFPIGADVGSAAVLSQRGLVPNTARSLVFWGRLTGVDLVLNGNTMSYTAIGSANNYAIYAADVSGYAGQSVELSFMALVNGVGTIDNIQFSSNAIPEPGTFALVALGVVGLGWRRRRGFVH